MVGLLAGFVTVVFSYAIYSLMAEEENSSNSIINIDAKFLKKIVSILLLFIVGVLVIVLVGYNLL